MDRPSLKRARSENEDDNNNVPQTKVWVNQKMNDLNDKLKMKAVHDKTTKMLFDAAAAIDKTSLNQTQQKLTGTTDSLVLAGDGGGASTSSATTSADPPSLCDQYQLLGDGTILLRDLRVDMSNPNLERSKSLCCQRQTLIHGNCVNCTMDLCEECGYSCVECAKFICRTCVTLFGNRPQDREDPMCERCQMFCA